MSRNVPAGPCTDTSARLAPAPPPALSTGLLPAEASGYTAGPPQGSWGQLTECHHGWQGWCAHERAPSPVKHCHMPLGTESQGAVLRKAASERVHAQALVTCLPSPQWLMLCSTCTGDCHMRRGRDSASRRLRERSSGRSPRKELLVWTSLVPGQPFLPAHGGLTGGLSQTAGPQPPPRHCPHPLCFSPRHWPSTRTPVTRSTCTSVQLKSFY